MHFANCSGDNLDICFYHVFLGGFELHFFFSFQLGKSNSKTEQIIHAQVFFHHVDLECESQELFSSVGVVRRAGIFYDTEYVLNQFC